MQRQRCGRPRGSVSRAVALHCKSTAPGAATVRKEPYSRTLPGDRPLSFRRAGRSRTRAGRPRPALHPDGTTAVPGLVRDVGASPKAARSRQRIARSPPPAALPDAAQRWRGAAAPLQQLLRRGAARRRARAHSVDGWTTVYDQDGRPRAMPDELVGAPANRCCALLRQHDEPPYTLQPQNRAARDEGVAHTLPTHYERDATAGTREADGTLQICMRPRAFKLRRARIAARATARPSA